MEPNNPQDARATTARATAFRWAAIRAGTRGAAPATAGEADPGVFYDGAWGWDQ